MDVEVYCAAYNSHFVLEKVRRTMEVCVHHNLSYIEVSTFYLYPFL